MFEDHYKQGLHRLSIRVGPLATIARVPFAASGGLRVGDDERGSQMTGPRAFIGICPFVVAGTGPVGVLA